MNPDKNDKALADKMIKTIIEVSPIKPIKAFFYGSRAKGTSDTDSDLDLLIVYDTSKDTLRNIKKVIDPKIKKIKEETDIFFHTCLKTKSEYESFLTLKVGKDFQEHYINMLESRNVKSK